MDRKQINSHYDVVIIGGGITGAGILRDLAIHNVKTLLLEKSDFSSQTSQGSSKMLHGGIRYLENLDFSLVFEALKERNLWLKLAPHLCYSHKFYLPAHKDSKYPKMALALATIIYKFLSGKKGEAAGSISKEKMLELFPYINSNHITGGAVYEDAIVDDARLCIECIMDALTYPSANALNYAQVIRVEKQGPYYEVEFFHEREQRNIIVKTKQVVIAAGPFTDKLMHELKLPWQNILLPSKGVHLWIERSALEINYPIVLQTSDNRVIFVIPQKHAVLVGTTETKVKVEENIQPTQSEVEYLLNQLNNYFPSAKISHQNILRSFAAIRPLVAEGGIDQAGKVSRHHQIYQPMSGLFVIAGGKYTTFRSMANDLCMRVMNRLNRAYNPNATLAPLRYENKWNPFTQQDCEFLEKIKANEMALSDEDLNIRRLGKLTY